MIVISPDSRLLNVSDILLDDISHFDAASRIDGSQLGTLDSTESQAVDSIENTLENATKEDPLAVSSCLHPNNSDAFWRTLVTNRTFSQNKPSDWR